MYIDTHAHLDSKKFSNDLDVVIKRAKEKMVVSILTSGVNHSSNLKALELSKKYDIVNASLGLYPIDALAKEIESDGLARDIEPIDVDEELEFIKENKNNILAVGEVGMDFSLSNKKSLNDFWGSSLMISEIVFK